jgi:hypothetical protein
LTRARERDAGQPRPETDKVDGITILGQLGEAPKLDHSESIAIAKRIIKRASVPIIVGVSAPGFAAMRSLAREVMELGAAGVMIGPPNTLRTDDRIVTYYRQAAEAIGSDVLFVLQDYPLTFTVVMTPIVIRRIVSENPSCVMLKHEDWPGAYRKLWRRPQDEPWQSSFQTLLPCGSPKQSASSQFRSHTVHAPAKPKSLRSHSMASEPWRVRRAVWKDRKPPIRGMGLLTRK